jgi:hypothetical protein
LGFAAISQISSQLLMLRFGSSLPDSRVQTTLASWSLIDQYSPFLLAGLLMVSMILFFTLRTSALIWFSIYLGLVFLFSVQQALTTAWLEVYGLQGILSSLGGLVFLSIVLGYMIHLNKREVLQ